MKPNPKAIEIITALGGTSKLALIINRTPQAVHHMKSRGMPDYIVKLLLVSHGNKLSNIVDHHLAVSQKKARL